MGEPGQDETEICPRCAETIKIKALVCRYCGFEYDQPLGFSGNNKALSAGKNSSDFGSNIAKAPQINLRARGCLFAVGVLFLLVLIGQCSSDKSSAPVDSASDNLTTAVKLPPAIRGNELVKAAKSEVMAVQAAIVPPIEAPTALYLRSWNWREEYSHVIAEGQVKNQTSEPIENLVAVVTFMDKAGNLITADDALVDFRPLLAGQTTPFKVIATYNPEMRTANIRFRTFAGQEIPYTEKRSLAKPNVAISQRKLAELIQSDLNFLGYYDDTSDGVVTDKTVSAIERFQKAYDIKVDGKPSVELAAAARTATLHQPIKPPQ